jgi:hypothetical protein
LFDIELQIVVIYIELFCCEKIFGIGVYMSFIKSKKFLISAVAVVLVAAIVIGLSGNLFGLYTSDARGVSSTAEQREVVRQLEELQREQPLLVVADESVLPFIRTEAPEVAVLYGRDLYQPGMDLGIVDMYSEELLGLYTAVKNPEDTIDDILATADLYGCNAVVVKQFEDAPKQLGHFKQYFYSENYIVYAIQ